MTTTDQLVKLGYLPALDSVEGGRWMRQQTIRKCLTESGESPQVVAALSTLVAALDSVVALYEGEPEGTSMHRNVLAFLEVLTGPKVYGEEGLKGLPRISNAPLCVCGHARDHHYTDPTRCRSCTGDSDHHAYTPPARERDSCW